MGSAFNDILGHVGNAADAVLLGGTVGKARRRSAFADMIEEGDYAGAEQLAVRNQAPQYARYAVSKGEEASNRQAAQRAQSHERLGSLAYHLDALPQEKKMQRLQQVAPALVQSGILQEGDLPALQQAAQVDGGLTALYRSLISVDDQVAQRTTEATKFGDTLQGVTTDNIAGTVQANQVAQRGPTFAEQTGRMNANTSRQSADLQRQRLNLDGQKFEASQRPEPQSQQDLAAIEAQRSTLTQLLSSVDRLGEGDLSQGFDDAYGFRRPVMYAPTDPNRGRIDAEALIDQIAGGLTLEQADQLKGVLSDKDMQLLERSASRLSNRNISDEEAATALAEVKQLFQTKLQALPGAPQPNAIDQNKDPLGIR